MSLFLCLWYYFKWVKINFKLTFIFNQLLILKVYKVQNVLIFFTTQDYLKSSHVKYNTTTNNIFKMLVRQINVFSVIGNTF